jgi:hypothetical protein
MDKERKTRDTKTVFHSKTHTKTHDLNKTEHALTLHGQRKKNLFSDTKTRFPHSKTRDLNKTEKALTLHGHHVNKERKHTNVHQ